MEVEGFLKTRFPSGCLYPEPGEPAYARTKEVTRKITLRGSGDLFLPPSTNCAIRSIVVNRIINKTDGPVTLTRIGVHPVAAEDWEMMRTASAAVKSNIDEMRVVPANGGQEQVINLRVMQVNPEWIYLHASFIQTFVLLTPPDLDVGLTPLPDGTVLVPHDHILAWPLWLPEKTRERLKLHAREIRVGPKRTLVGFAVAPDTLATCREEIVSKYMTPTAIDRGSIGRYGIHATGQVEMLVFVTYIEVRPPPPPAEDNKKLWPVLHPDFEPFGQILRRREEALFIEKMLSNNRTDGPGESPTGAKDE